MQDLLKQFFMQRDPAHSERVIPRLSHDFNETPEEEEVRKHAELKAWNLVHGFPDPNTDTLEAFRARVGLPAPTAAEIEEYNKKRAALLARVARA
jgi:hypothetical protein